MTKLAMAKFAEAIFWSMGNFLRRDRAFEPSKSGALKYNLIKLSLLYRLNIILMCWENNRVLIRFFSCSFVITQKNQNPDSYRD